MAVAPATHAPQSVFCQIVERSNACVWFVCLLACLVLFCCLIWFDLSWLALFVCVNGGLVRSVPHAFWNVMRATNLTVLRNLVSCAAPKQCPFAKASRGQRPSTRIRSSLPLTPRIATKRAVEISGRGKEAGVGPVVR